MKKSLIKRVLAGAMAVCMVLSMVGPVSAVDLRSYALKLYITEENATVKPSSNGSTKIAVTAESGSVLLTDDLTDTLVYLLAANFEGNAKQNKTGLWQFESDAMGLTIEAGLKANRTSDAAWFSWIDTFASEGRITGEDKGSLVDLLKSKSKIGDMETNTEYVLYYEPDNTVKLNPENSMPLHEKDPAKGNTYIFTLTLVEKELGAEDHPITVQPVTNGSLSTDVNRARMNERVTITARADTGYTVAGIAVTQGTTRIRVRSIGNGQYTFTMPDGAVTVSATIRPVDYNIGVKVNNGTATTPDPDAQMGETVTIHTTADRGYEVDTVTVTNDETGEQIRITPNGDGSYDFEMPAGHVTVTVGTKLRNYNIGVRYDDGGTASANLNTARMGDPVKVRTTVKPGYKIKSVTVMVVDEAPVMLFRARSIQRAVPMVLTPDSNGEYPFLMPADHVEVNMVTELKAFSVKVNPGINGTAMTDKSSATMNQTVTITPTPNAGYEVDQVTVTGATGNVSTNKSNGTWSFTMPVSDVKVNVTYKLKEYNISVEPDANGTANSNKQKAKANDTVIITPTPNQGYEVKNVKVTCGTQDILVTDNGDGTYSFVMPNGDVTVSVTTKETAPSGGGSETQGHLITVAPVINGEAEASAERAKEGETVTITATANPGYKVTGVQVDGSPANDDGNGNWSFVMPNKDVTVTVNIEAEQYAVNVEQPAHGTAGADKASAKAGETVIITTTGEEGYKVTGIKVTQGTNDVTVADNGNGTYSFTMPIGAVDVTVITEEETYSVDVAPVSNGAAQTDKTLAQFGDSVTITAEAALGYVVADVVVDQGGTPVDVTSNNDGTYSFTMPAGDVTVTVTTMKETYDITVDSVDNGTADTDKDHAQVGDEVIIEAKANLGYEIVAVQVTGDTPVTSISEGKWSFNMPANDATVTVVTKAKEYRVNVENVVNGSAVAAPKIAVMGEKVTITVTAEDGYEVAEVKATGGVNLTDNGDGTYSFNMPADDVTVTATVWPKPVSGSGYRIIVNEVEHGRATTNVEHAEAGETVTITAVADTGYVVADVKVAQGGTPVSVTDNGDGTYSFTMPAGEAAVTVTTRPEEYSITVNSVANGNAATDVNHAQAGETVTITATANQGYTVDTVKVSCGGTPVEVTDIGNGKYSFVMPAGAVTVDVATKAEKYAITVESVSNGTAITDKDTAAAGETVTITATANTGYVVDTVAVVYGSTPVAVTNNGNGKYSFTMPAGAVKVTVTTKSSGGPSGPSGPSGGGGGSITKEYAINVAAVNNGTAKADATKAEAGKKITVTVTTNEGYVVDSVVVRQQGAAGLLTVVDNGDGTYSFTMPAGAVTVTVTTKEKTDTPADPYDPSDPSHNAGCSANKFGDVDLDAWYHRALDYVLKNGLMAGYSSTEFGTNDSLSRAMVAQLFYNMEGQPKGDYEDKFPDVAEGKWYYNAITWAYEHGVVSGYGDGLYRPDKAVSREELVQIFCNYAKAKGWSEGTRIADLTGFVDYKEIASWHEVAVSWGVGSGILGGKGENIMAPKMSATRAEAAQMLMSLCEKVKK